MSANDNMKFEGYDHAVDLVLNGKPHHSSDWKFITSCFRQVVCDKTLRSACNFLWFLKFEAKFHEHEIDKKRAEIKLIND